MTSWIKNTGVEPDIRSDEKIEVVFRDGSKDTGYAIEWRWNFSAHEGDIFYWRKCSEQSLETAYDVPPKTMKISSGIPSADTQGYQKLSYPETNYLPTAKRSVSQLVSDSFNQLSGKNITAAEVESIITLHEVMKKMEN